MSAKDASAPRRTTIRTVAADAGVSVAAVSKVLRNAYGVSEVLRSRVNASIERLGYRPNSAARGLRGRTFTIGVLLTELTNPFLAQIVDGVSDVIEPSGYKFMFGVGRTDVSLETQLIETMIDARMDGLILIAPLLEPVILDHFARQIPTVVIAHHEATATTFDTISGDDVLGGRIATEALLAKGHRDVLMLSLDFRQAAEINVSGQREIGYREAMAAAGFADRARIVRIPMDRDSGEAQIAALLDRADRPPAIFCWSDLHGVGLRNMAALRGLRVPEELAIVSYDNSNVAALPLVNLASIDQNGRGQGAASARALLSRIGGRREPSHLLLNPTLVARSSLGPA